LTLLIPGSCTPNIVGRIDYLLSSLLIVHIRVDNNPETLPLFLFPEPLPCLTILSPGPR
jgi:hypothetical protein